MNISAEMVEQLRQLKAETDLSEPFISLSFYAPEELERRQVGYSVDGEGRSLASNEEGKWQSGWIAIGRTGIAGDPVIVDTEEDGLPVSCLMHGMGDWRAGSYIAGSIGQCKDTIVKIRALLASNNSDRTKGFITCADLDAAVAEIEAADSYADADAWRALLEPSYRTVRQQEEALVGTIRSMAGQGVKVKDIAYTLGLPLEIAYSFWKKAKSVSENC